MYEVLREHTWRGKIGCIIWVQVVGWTGGWRSQRALWSRLHFACIQYWKLLAISGARSTCVDGQHWVILTIERRCTDLRTASCVCRGAATLTLPCRSRGASPESRGEAAPGRSNQQKVSKYNISPRPLTDALLLLISFVCGTSTVVEAAAHRWSQCNSLGLSCSLMRTGSPRTEHFPLHSEGCCHEYCYISTLQLIILFCTLRTG